MRGRVAVVLAALAMTTSVGALAVRGSVERTSSVAPSDGLVDETSRLRDAFGFQADEAFVRATFANPHAFPVSPWGLPLNESEVQEVWRRIEVQNAIGAATDYATSQPDFGGAYLDQKGGAIPHYLFTGDAERHRNAITAALPSGQAFQLDIVPHTKAELTAVQYRIDEASKSKTLGSRVVSTRVPDRLNRVVVGLEDPSSKNLTLLRSLFGPTIDVMEDHPGVVDDDQCIDIRRCIPEEKGGIKTYIWNDAGAYCTTGFIGRRSGGTSTALVAVTAGHCLALLGSGGNQDWEHWSTNIGGELGNTWYDYALGDVGLIQLDSDNQPNPRNHLLGRPDLGLSGVRSVTETKPNNQQIEDVFLCRVGAGSEATPGVSLGGWNCGHIFDDNVTNLSCRILMTDCFNIQHTWEVTFDSRPGDSGGPYYQFIPNTNNVTAFGTHVHSDIDTNPLPRYGWYSTENWGRNAYNEITSDNSTYVLCTTAAC